jgi:CheY-like chemotaxis protein
MTHILIAEDEERIAAFVAKGLRTAGYEATAVTTGEETVARVRAGGVDLLVLDLGRQRPVAADADAGVDASDEPPTPDTTTSRETVTWPPS